MNKQFFGNYQAKILSYNGKARTAQVSVPTVTGDLEEGITATFAYPVSHDDRDTELEILPNADCYVFFEQGDPYSPVIFAYKSHGVGAILDYRRIRQENIELLARRNITFEAGNDVSVKAGNNISVESGGYIDVQAQGDISTETQGNMRQKTIGNYESQANAVQMESLSVFKVDAAGNVVITSGGVITLNASNIVLNGALRVTGQAMFATHITSNGTVQIGGGLSVGGYATLNGITTIQGIPYLMHGHIGVKSGTDISGGTIGV